VGKTVSTTETEVLEAGFNKKYPAPVKRIRLTHRLITIASAAQENNIRRVVVDMRLL
jgi:hypothetical protein